MNKSLIKSISTLICASLFLFSFITKSERSDFSGTWKLNEGKSELGQFANFATRTIKTEQKEGGITIARTAPSFSGDEATTSETLTFDGKESETSLFGNSKKKSIASWSEDGQTLIMTYNLSLDFNGQVTEVSGKETWTLSNGGKTLIAENNSSSSFGDLATKSVYDKQ